jgi:hypothetical protein
MNESDDRDGAEVLKSLPSRRPQRRSTRRDGAKPKRAAAPKAAKPAAARPAARRKPAASRKPAGVRPSAATSRVSSTPAKRPALPPEGLELVGTAVQAAGELAQLGLTLGTKALRGAVSRIPRP